MLGLTTACLISIIFFPRFNGRKKTDEFWLCKVTADYLFVWYYPPFKNDSIHVRDMQCKYLF